MNDKPEKASLFIIGLMIFLVSFFYLLLGATSASAQPPKKEMTRNEYIEMYKEDAIKEMKKNGVPASITLAQGILESNCGNSTLAVKANNHFGIKCHSDWNGKTFKHDDDKKNECFRKYKTVLESYDDHSLFLKGSKRYQFLFEMNSTDYKAWAHGLKKAGYATDPKYPDKLIKIIEESNLAQYDNGVMVAELKPKTVKEETNTTQVFEKHKIFKTNKRKHILAREGDTFYSLSKAYKIELHDILKYNDCDEDHKIPLGGKIYLEPKRRKAELTNYKVKEGDTMHSISQEYGVKKSRIYRFNDMKKGTEPKVGEVIKLQP